MSGLRRFLSIAVGAPPLAIILLGAVGRFSGGDLKLPLSTYVATILFGGLFVIVLILGAVFPAKREENSAAADLPTVLVVT
ncbi:MAG: hypothetical protein ACYC0L_02990 [Thermoleophilia bacterium]